MTAEDAKDETGDQVDRLGPAEHAAIAALFGNLPATYPEVQFKLSALTLAFRTEVARQLQPHLKQWVQSEQRPYSLSEARNLTRFVDSMLRNLGVCVTIDGEPAILSAERSTASSLGRPSECAACFTLLMRTDTPPYFRKAATSDTLPELNLAPATDNLVHHLEPVRRHAYAYAMGRPK